MPAIGLGTWKMEDGVAEDAVTKAIELGYRYFDCAPIYLNEAEIGESFGAAFTGGGHDRSEFGLPRNSGATAIDPTWLRERSNKLYRI